LGFPEARLRYNDNHTPKSRTDAPLALFLCFAAAILEGFDILVMPVAAPQLSQEYRLLPNQLGSIFAVSSVGLLVGNILGGRLGDRFDRRLVLTGAIAVFGFFTLATIFSDGYTELLTVRGTAGLGFGFALPNLIAIGARLSTTRRRFSTNAAIFWGMPLGGVIVSGIMSAFSGGNWRNVFIIGGVLPLLIAPFYLFALPKNHEPPGERVRKNLIAILFLEGRLRPTMLVWGTFITAYVAIYIVSTWMPTITLQRGMGARVASQTLLAYNLLGMVGIFVIGRIADRFGYRGPATAAFLISSASLAVLSYTKNSILLLCAAAVVGGSLSGGLILLYAVAAAQYPPYAKGAGTGAALATGRAGSIMAPLIAGFLLQAGVPSVDVMLLPVAAALSAALMVWQLGRRQY
jgi:MFS transporter, AAHS family, 3-hydroxyphenylpropionic acid transporter